MLIDFHTHTFPDKIAASALEQLGTRAGISPHTDGTYQGLRDAMARDGVDVSVVLPVATNPSQVEKINRRALQTNETASDTGIYSFGAMHPDYPADVAGDDKNTWDAISFRDVLAFCCKICKIFLSTLSNCCLIIPPHLFSITKHRSVSSSNHETFALKKAPQPLG